MTDSTTNVLDLPQIHQKPTFAELYAALQSLQVLPASWDAQRELERSSTGIATSRYLMAIVSSPLQWMNEEEQESIWDEASKRIAERSGVNAMPAMTRSWLIPSADSSETIVIKLHEPGLTEDNLGLKTWGSSYVMAKMLPSIAAHITSKSQLESLTVLELGAGTGLVGLAAAINWQCQVALSDLPEIVPNLAKNIMLNQEHFGEMSKMPSVHEIDWCHPPDVCDVSGPFDVVLAADPLYDVHHAPLLARNVDRFLKCDSQSRAIIMYPLRDTFTKSLGETLMQELRKLGFMLLHHDAEVGYDDWEVNGERAEIISWWGVWQRKMKLQP